MGEYADDILDGNVDEQTGEWIGGGQGFPRSLNRNGANAAPQQQINGIKAFLKRLCIDGNNITLAQVAYLNDTTGSRWNARSKQDMAAEIQKDWQAFANYIHKHQKDYKSPNFLTNK